VSSKDVRDGRTGNRLIDCLGERAALEITSRGQRVELPRGEILYRQNGPMSHVYFPTVGCCCHLIPSDEGRQIEATTIGNEGMVGIDVALGLDFSPLMAVCVVPCQAIRVPVRSFLDITEAGGSLDRLIRKYAVYCLRLASQTIACNAFHSVEQRVCRRLLMAKDRVGRGEFSLTQELLGRMLGVRRQTITLVARTLQAADFIEYWHGTIKILNRPGLEAASCDCYKIAKSAYDSIVMN
jgi:CRP-like cAMP-binding protein